MTDQENLFNQVETTIKKAEPEIGEALKKQIRILKEMSIKNSSKSIVVSKNLNT